VCDLSLSNAVAHKLCIRGLPVPEGELKIGPGAATAMIQKRLSIRGWPSGTAKDSEETVAFAQEMGVECQVETFSLKDADKAYEQ
jgi:D-arabinose 1-dehydrogenase-like Zn-dependent alcohol dehydrogenase